MSLQPFCTASFPANIEGDAAMAEIINMTRAHEAANVEDFTVYN